MVIWRDVAVKVYHKFVHITKIGGKVFNRFANDHGDVPVAHWNGETGTMEQVVNHRGRAYAMRKHDRYRRDRRKDEPLDR
jgi:hypothetical protein